MAFSLFRLLFAVSRETPLSSYILRLGCTPKGKKKRGGQKEKLEAPLLRCVCEKKKKSGSITALQSFGQFSVDCRLVHIHLVRVIVVIAGLSLSCRSFPNLIFLNCSQCCCVLLRLFIIFFFLGGTIWVVLSDDGGGISHRHPSYQSDDQNVDLHFWLCRWVSSLYLHHLTSYTTPEPMIFILTLTVVVVAFMKYHPAAYLHALLSQCPKKVKKIFFCPGSWSGHHYVYL